MQNISIESGVQLFSRMNSQNLEILNGINPKLFPEGGPFTNQVIELIFEEDIDSTDILIDFIVRAILPPKYGEEFKGVEVILINTDFQINLFKIIKFIEKKTETFIKKSEKKYVIEAALKNLIFLNCYTSEQLEITFYNLERTISNCQNLALVILDNILSQYWCAKFNNFMLSFDEHCSKMLELFYEKIKNLNVAMMYVRQGHTSGIKKKESQKIAYSIEISKSEEVFLAKITNFEKDSTTLVHYKIDVCPYFL